jgi:RNA polymerase sigma-70 factor (ECF subfamily)
MVTPETPVDYHSAGQTGTAGGSLTQATQKTTAASLADLLGAGAEGDQRAFEQLYQRTSAKLLSVCFHLLRRRDLAEEVLQEAYLRIWRGARGYHPGRGAPMTWMISIARNAAIDRLRQTRRQLQEVDSGQEEEAFPEPVADLRDEVLQNDSARALGACLETLDEGQRQAIVLSYCFGYSHEELADRLSIPLGTAKSWIRRGLLKLKVCMEP